jgi:hypothetical protein
MGYLSGQWKMKDHGHLSEATPLPSIGIFDSLSTAPTQRKERGFMHSSPPPASNHIAYKTVHLEIQHSHIHRQPKTLYFTFNVILLCKEALRIWIRRCVSEKNLEEMQDWICRKWKCSTC